MKPLIIDVKVQERQTMFFLSNGKTTQTLQSSSRGLLLVGHVTAAKPQEYLLMCLLSLLTMAHSFYM